MKALIIIALTLFSCSEFDYSNEYRIDPRLSCYVDKFFKEANEHGINIYKENLIVSIEPVNSAGVSRVQGSQRIIIISNNAYEYFTSDNWVHNADSAYYGLENLMYHELGHALLKRKHECDSCYSIMSAGLNCFTYTSECNERKILIDELFNVKN